jgi:hypothetical protein
MEEFGLSGDLIFITDNKIIKTCRTDQNRFIKNIKKQIEFKENIIKSVPILNQGINSNNENFIEMPRLKCDNAMVWISKATSNQIYDLEKIILEYFSSIINNSKKKEFDYNIWKNKLEDLFYKINDIEIKNIIFYLNEMKFKNKLYYGNYHGDFTLTNLFVYSDKNNIEIDAIDFLDSFIHSPINDLVKIRQDTKHLWTLNLIRNFNKIDTNRVLILLNYMDIQIEKFINKNKILSEYYLPFQLINLIRIIPYVKDENIFIYLKGEIINLFNIFEAKNACQ